MVNDIQLSLYFESDVYKYSAVFSVRIYNLLMDRKKNSWHVINNEISLNPSGGHTGRAEQCC